jgi:hypothetical protein
VQLHLTRRDRDRIVLGLCFGGAAVLLVLALIVWRHDGSSDGGAATGSGSGDGTGALLPPQVAANADDESLDSLLKGTKDPFDPTTVSNRGAKHRVTVQATSDGTMYLGFLYRDGKGAGVYLKTFSYETSRGIRGELPSAKIAVKMLADATYARCTILIDGKKAVSHTIHKANKITVCLA